MEHLRAQVAQRRLRLARHEVPGWVIKNSASPVGTTETSRSVCYVPPLEGARIFMASYPALAAPTALAACWANFAASAKRTRFVVEFVEGKGGQPERLEFFDNLSTIAAMLQRFHKCLSSGCPRFPLPLLVSGSAVKLVVLKNPERAGGQVVSGCIRDNASGESLLAKPASRENYDDGLIGTSPFCTWDTAFSSLALPLRTTSNWRMGKILAEADRAGSISPVTARGDQGLGDRGRPCDLAGPVVLKRAKRAPERSPRLGLHHKHSHAGGEHRHCGNRYDDPSQTRTRLALHQFLVPGDDQDCDKKEGS